MKYHTGRDAILKLEYVARIEPEARLRPKFNRAQSKWAIKLTRWSVLQISQMVQLARLIEIKRSCVFFSLLSYSSSFGRFPLCILFFLSSPTVPEPRLSLCFAQQSMQKLVSKQGQFDKSILVHY
jgi:hypothetical protein